MKLLGNIDQSLVRLKLHYLLHGMGGAPVVPFGSLVGRQLGVSPQGMGFIFAFIPIAGIVVKPFLGGIADKYGVKKIVLMSVIFSAMVHYYSLQYLPVLPSPPSAEVTCSSTSFLTLARDPCMVEKLQRMFNDSHIICDMECASPERRTEKEAVEKLSLTAGMTDKVYHKSLQLFPGRVLDLGDALQLPVQLGPCNTRPVKMACTFSCESAQDLAQIINRPKDGSSVFSCAEYWLFVLVITLASLSFGSGCTFQESICHEVLGEDGQQKYGQQRLWASVGWGLMAAVSGYVVDMDSRDSLLFNYSTAFKIMAACWVADLMVVSGLRVPERAGISTNPWAEVGKLFSSMKTIAFLFWCVMVGFVFGAMGLHFWLLEDLGGNKNCDDSRNIKLLQGLCLTVNCIGETPVFFLSGVLLSWLGNSLCMTVVLVAHGVRLLYYSMIVTPWQVLPIELVQGITFGLFFPCLVSVSAQSAPPGAETTMTTLAFIMFDGLGCSLGGWVSGWLYQAVGGSLTYRYFGWAALGGAAVNMWLQGRVRREEAISKVSVC